MKTSILVVLIIFMLTITAADGKSLTGEAASIAHTISGSTTPIFGSINPLGSNNPSGSNNPLGSNNPSDYNNSSNQWWQTGSYYWQTTYQNTENVNPGDNTLWIYTPQGRIRYADVPQYSQISLIASTLLGGQGVIYELYPVTGGQSTYTSNVYNLNPGDNRLEFAANIIGRHILLFTINNQISNAVIIDVQNGINSLPQQSNGPILGQGV